MVSKAERIRIRREAADAEYRRMLGVAGSALPSKIGQADSGGASRGGRGARQRGRGRRK